MKSKILNKNSYLFNKIYFFFFLLLPFVYSDKIIDPVLIPRQIYLTVFILILGFVVLFEISKKELVSNFSFLKLTLPLLLFVFLFIIGLSLIKTSSSADGIYVLSKFTIELLFFVLSTYLIIQNKLIIRGLVYAILSFCIVSILIALYQALTLDFAADFRDNIYQITSSFVNKNLFSSLLFLCFPFIIGGIYLSKKWKITSIVVLCFIFLLLVFIQTRAVILATGLSIIIFLLIQKGLILETRFQKVILLLIFTLGIVILICFRESSFFSNLFDSVSLHQRLLVWNNSLQMAKENLILGVGPGNWQFHFTKYGVEKFNDVLMDSASLTYQRPHNDFLWVFCETGIFGLIAYISIFIVALLYIFKILKNKEDSNSEDKVLLYAFFSIITGYIFISFFDFPLERIEHQIIFYLILSIIVAKYYCSIQNDKHKSNSFNSNKLKWIIFLPAVFSLIVSIYIFSGEFHTRKIYEYQSQGDLKNIVAEADKSLNLFYVADPTSIPINWYKGVALFTLGNLSEAQTCFEKAKLISPYNIHVLNNLASCYEMAGKHKEAEEMYIKALLISPRFDEARLNLSAVYFNTKEYEKAFFTIDKVAVTSKDEKYPVYLTAILNSWLGLMIANQKDKDAIDKIYEIKSSKTKMMEYYFKSKKNKITYLQYILSKN